MSNKITAPWTEEQVETLQKYQENSCVHPYTCECGELLVPTTDEWECEVCSYTQNWFWEYSLEIADHECPLRKFLEINPHLEKPNEL